MMQKYFRCWFRYFPLLGLAFLTVFPVAAQDTGTTSTGSSTTSSSTATTSSVVQAAQRQGVSEEQLKLMGIDTSDPAKAAERARQLGASEADIKRALEASKKTSGTSGETSPAGESLAGETEGETIEGEGFEEGEGEEGEDKEKGKKEEEEKKTEDKKKFDAKEDSTLWGTGRFEGIRYYGYDIFRPGKNLVGPIEVGPVDPGYPIGAGDVLRVTLWGEVEFQNELTVSRDGNIVMPRVGQIFVAGTRLDRLRETMKNYLSRYYSGLAQNPPTIFMDVTIARLRSSQIFVMGEVMMPGAYSISSYATAFNAMYAIGGPKVSGSLREIRILRDGKTLSRVDLYDYLLKGTSTNDQRLQMGDIVFVPPRQLTVAITGEVLRPGIYEATASEGITDLVKFAGGLNPGAYSFRAQIDRLVPVDRRTRGQSEHELIDVNLDDVLSKKQVVRLADGDVVQIFPIVDKLVNYVNVAGGGVVRPGRYELGGKIRTVGDLVLAADGVTPDAFISRAHLVRTRKDLKTEFIQLDLTNQVQCDLELIPLDSLRIYSQAEMSDTLWVKLSGYAKAPGRYPYHENMTLHSLLFAFSGLQDSLRWANAFMERGNIFRLNDDGKTRTVIPFYPQRVWEEKDNINLKARDEVVLYSNEVREYVTRKVWISGEIKNQKAGAFEWKENLTLADAILHVGGFAPGAWLLDAEVVRIPQTGIPGDTLAYSLKVPMMSGKKMPDDPEKAIEEIFLENSLARKFQLEPGDRIFIRANPNYAKPQIVTLTGEVQYPGSYAIDKQNETVGDIIMRAGGLKSTAYVSAGRLLRGKNQLYMDFEKLLVEKKKRNDVVLLAGDQIIIPKKPNSVLVSGEVFNPGYFQFRPGLNVIDYLKMSGGRTENGGQVYVTDPSGFTDQVRFMHNPKVKDGSVIVVNQKEEVEKGEKTDWAEVVKETTAIISSAMMVVYLSKQVSE